jgi:hypothetical protein
VVATDFAGNVGPPSNAATVTTPPAPPPPSTLAFAPVADATLKQSLPTTNFGSSKTLDVDGSPLEHVLLKFEVTGVGGRAVLAARLRLYITNASTEGGRLHRLGDTSWGEASVTWSTAPASDPETLASLGPVTTGVWVEADVSGFVTGDGTFALRIDSPSGNGAAFRSRNAPANRPQLVVTTAP